MYDPGQQVVWLDKQALMDGSRGASILILNDYELGMYQKKTGLKQKDILELADTLIVTLGDQGSVIHIKGDSFQIPIAKLRQQMDPTGVGDAYRAGLMKGLLHGLPWDISGRLGSLCAAYVLETDGPQNHSFDLAEFVDRYSETFGEADGLRGLLSKS
jgi:adenosine kinase